MLIWPEMKPRYLAGSIADICFKRRKMAFVSGPRQCGKTTLAKHLLNERGAGNYFNWDETTFRKMWVKDPAQVIPPDQREPPLVVLDEIHKAKLWKRTLKGLYDTLKNPADILVTGSARLNLYKKGGDSLLGRYYHFRLHPFSLREMAAATPVSPERFIESLFSHSLKSNATQKSHWGDLLTYGGFPEPLFSSDKKVARLWRKNRVEKIIREDLRDLSRIPELSQIEMLVSLLPDRVGSLFSMTSLREDLEVSLPTVKRWLNYLKELYYLFEIKPFSRSVSRSLRKGGKIYLWDFGEVVSEPARFENMVACHLLKTCHFWTDTGEGQFDLFYLRDKEKREIDFLITKNGAPWLPIEVKLGDTTPSPHWRPFLNQLNVAQGVQIIKTPNVWRNETIDNSKVLIASGSDVLAHFQ